MNRFGPRIAYRLIAAVAVMAVMLASVPTGCAAADSNDVCRRPCCQTDAVPHRCCTDNSKQPTNGCPAMATCQTHVWLPLRVSSDTPTPDADSATRDSFDGSRIHCGIVAVVRPDAPSFSLIQQHVRLQI